jgi:mRNA interferase MazF
MKEPGQIVVFRFPQTNLKHGKLRPALLIAKVPGRFDDWLTSVISTQLHQAVDGFDEIISENDPDYAASGLKMDSVIRVGRLGVLDGTLFEGAIGKIAPKRLKKIKSRLADWLKQ